MSVPPSQGAIEPNLHDAPFWEATCQGKLVFQCCADCGRFRHPPLPRCPACNSDRIAWQPAPSRAELYSWTVVHRPAGQGEPDRYVIGLALFRTCGDIRLVTNIVSPEPERLRIGMPLELVWEPCGDFQAPRFRGVTDA